MKLITTTKRKQQLNNRNGHDLKATRKRIWKKNVTERTQKRNGIKHSNRKKNINDRSMNMNIGNHQQQENITKSYRRHRKNLGRHKQKGTKH